MKRIKAIIFDCDGILVDSEPIQNEVLFQMLAHQCIVLDRSEIEPLLAGRRLKDCLSIIEAVRGRTLPLEFENEYRKETELAFVTSLKAVEGVYGFLKDLNLSICVASSGPVEKIVRNLTTTGLIKFFQGRIFSSYEINSWKPAPEIFLHACEKLGFAPNECIVIEDSVAGVQAAVTGGFDVFALARNNNTRNTLDEAGAVVFHRFDELKELLKERLA